MNCVSVLQKQWIRWGKNEPGPVYYSHLERHSHDSVDVVGNETKMKAISIKQPWATMIVSGEKTIETRTWSTNYRGSLLIVSSKNPKILHYPTGCAMAIVELVDCRPMTKEDEVSACCELYQGAYAWILEDMMRIKRFPVKGWLGIYDVKHDIQVNIGRGND